MAVFLILLILLAVALVLAGAFSYRKTFRGRFSGGGDYFPYFSRLHPHWQRQAVSFPSNHGDILHGYVYSYDVPRKALIVLCHGYGMTMNDYLPECERFCRSGYAVLAFDGSGVGESEGILYGLPQHIFDLAACLDYVNSDPELSALPLLIYGHSWGGYSADCVSLLGHYPIQGLISASAFLGSLSALKPHMERHWSHAARLPLLGAQLYQRLKFGPLADATAADGLKKLDAPALILQSRDDGIIPFQDNYLVLCDTFRDDPRKIFLPLDGHNHNITTPSDVDSAKRKLLKFLRIGTATPEQLAEMEILKARLDEDLMEQFIKFYDNCIR